MPSAAAEAMRLDPPSLLERLARGEIIGHLAVRSIGGDDQNNTMPFGVSASHRTTGGDRLIVGMGV